MNHLDRALGGLLALFVVVALVSVEGASADTSNSGSLDLTSKARVPASQAKASEGEFLQVEPLGSGYLLLESQWSSPGGRSRRIERRSANGELDPSFGVGGEATVSIGSGFASMPDGAIMVGVDQCRGSGPALVLLDSSGSKVRFGRHGCSSPLGFAPDELVAESDGSVLVSGTERVGGFKRDAPDIREPVLARVGMDGSLDRQFGREGVVHLAHLGAPRVESTATPPVALTQDGDVLVGIGPFVSEIGSSGGLNQAFGVKGKARAVVSVDGTSDFSVSDIVTFPDGEIAVAAQEQDYSARVVVSRLLESGSQSLGFGSDGSVMTNLVGRNTVPPLLAIMPGEKALLLATLSDRPLAALLLLEPNGQPSVGYGTGGTAVLFRRRTPGLDLKSIATNSDGGAYLAGRRGNALAVARDSVGAPVASFGRGGTLLETRGR